MKKVLLCVMVVAMLLVPFVAKSQTLNIAYVDVQKVLMESERGKEARNTLSKEVEKLKKTLDDKQSELQNMKDAIEKQGATITADARAEKERQYQSKLKDYQRVYNDYQGELQQKDMELTQKIFKEVEEVVKGLGDREKYTIVLEKSQVLFASPTIDITNKVITLYNETAKKKSAN